MASVNEDNIMRCPRPEEEPGTRPYGLRSSSFNAFPLQVHPDGSVSSNLWHRLHPWQRHPHRAQCHQTEPGRLSPAQRPFQHVSPVALRFSPTEAQTPCWPGPSVCVAEFLRLQQRHVSNYFILVLLLIIRVESNRGYQHPS